jgi:hypothetical protein
VRRRIEAQVGVANGLLDLCRHALFPGLNTERTGIDQGHVGDGIDRHRRAVVLDLHVVEQAGMRTPGPHLGQVGLERLQDLCILCSAVFFTSAMDISISSAIDQGAFVSRPS